MMGDILGSNGYFAIVEIDESGERLKTDESNRFKKIYFNLKGEPYFKKNGIRWYLKDFLRIDIF